MFEKEKAFASIKAEFYEYVININISFKEEDIGLPLEPSYGFYYIDLENQPQPKNNRNSDYTPNNEGYIFKWIEVLTF